MEDAERLYELGRAQPAIDVSLHDTVQIREHDSDDPVASKHTMALTEDADPLVVGEVIESVRAIHDINARIVPWERRYQIMYEDTVIPIENEQPELPIDSTKQRDSRQARAERIVNVDPAGQDVVTATEVELHRLLVTLMYHS
jgi:hypothetical protein